MDLLFLFCIINILSSLAVVNSDEALVRSSFILIPSLFAHIQKIFGNFFYRQNNDCYSNAEECDEQKHRFVCGTDNQTYLSMCHLVKAQCKNQQLKLKYRGPCKGK